MVHFPLVAIKLATVFLVSVPALPLLSLSLSLSFSLSLLWTLLPKEAVNINNVNGQLGDKRHWHFVACRLAAPHHRHQQKGAFATQVCHFTSYPFFRSCYLYSFLVSLCLTVPLNLSLLYFCTLISVFSFAAACRSWQFDL